MFNVSSDGLKIWSRSFALLKVSLRIVQLHMGLCATQMKEISEACITGP